MWDGVRKFYHCTADFKHHTQNMRGNYSLPYIKKKKLELLKRFYTYCFRLLATRLEVGGVCSIAEILFDLTFCFSCFPGDWFWCF